jgi:nucleoid-associated protein YgaU
VSDSSIGIKQADGTYYPILEPGYTGTKKLTVTTAKDNQQKVQIDLFRGTAPARTADTPSAAQLPTHFIGSLVIENISPATKGEPEIELVVGVDDDGQLSATASDSRTGESQNFSTSLNDLPEEGEFTEAEFPEAERPSGAGFEEAPLTGEAYPDEERHEARQRRKGPNVGLLVLFVILGLLLVAAAALFIYSKVTKGPLIPSLFSSPAVTAPAQPAQPAAQPAQPAAQPAQPAAQPAQPVTYRIKKGDTLWDISATYYRNPWLYPKLAKANSIKNPDLIFAGTRITIPEN